MKKSITYLPIKNQKELHFIVEEILRRLKQTEMIILFGSYARDNYVVYDEKFEFGKVQFYVSDYDILVVTSGISEGVAGKALNNVESIYYAKAGNPDRQPPVQFINIDIKTLNKALKEGDYFFAQIKEEGVMLFDSENFKLTRRRKPNFQQIKEQSEAYYKDKFEKANEFLDHAYFDKDKERYKMASFDLHQACENYFYAIRLVYTQQNNKQHNLTKLLGSVKKYSDDLQRVFPLDTEEEIRLFDLVKAAYVNGRYDPDFIVTKHDIDAIIPKVELLRDLTKEICEKRIEEYQEFNDNINLN